MHGMTTHRGKQETTTGTANFIHHDSPAAWCCHAVNSGYVPMAEARPKPEPEYKFVDCDVWSLLRPYFVLALCFITMQVVVTSHCFMHTNGLCSGALLQYWITNKMAATSVAALWFSFGSFFTWFLLKPAPDSGKYRGFSRATVRSFLKRPAMRHPSIAIIPASAVTLSGAAEEILPRRPIRVPIDPIANIPIAQAFDLDAILKGVAALNVTVHEVTMPTGTCLKVKRSCYVGINTWDTCPSQESRH
jgi:hypothetical protein